MIAVFWKEIRENARWACLGFIAMAVAMISMWRASPLVFDSGPSGPSGLSSLDMLAGMIAVFTAIALGILQTRRDKRPASRALLLHRGLTADAAFAGKLLAGFVLYSFAVFVPLLAMALFIAINGIEHKAASAMSLTPMAFGALGTFGLWPAALLIVQRDARVFGSRLTPAVPALMTATLCVAPWETTGGWLLLFLITLLSLFVLLLAARSVFANSSPIATGIGRTALALTVSIALLVMFMFVPSTIESYRLSKVRASLGSSAVNRHYAVHLGPEGHPWLGRKDYSQRDGTYQLTQAAKMAVGRSVRDQLQPIAEDWRETPQRLIDLYHRHHVRGYWARYTLMASASSSNPAEFMHRKWVFDHKGETILVYHLTLSGQWQLARRLRAPDPVRSFGQVRRYGRSDTDGNFTLVTSTGAFYVPGDGSPVITMYQAPTSSAILDSVEHTHLVGGTHPSKHAREKDEPYVMMLRLADRVVLLEGDLDEIAASQARPIGEVGSIGSLYATEIQLPSELAEPKSLSIARDPRRDGEFLGLAQSSNPHERHIVWARFDANGQIVAQQEYIENTGPDFVYSSESTFFAFVPPGVWAVVFSTALIAVDDDLVESVWENAWESAKKDPARTAWGVLLYLLAGIVGVALAIWAARRRRLDKRQTWLSIAWGFLLGPAGSLSILAVYPRIARDRCVSCRQPTRIDLDRCEHCGHPADDVPRIGIEIFGRDPLAASKPAETIGSC